MKEDYQDRIENYLLNRMSDTDRLAFEQDLEKDAELRDQYEFISMVKTALMLENVEKDVTNWSKAYKEREVPSEAAANYRPTGTDRYCCPAPRIEQVRSKPHSSGRKILYWISGIAAVFVVGVFVFNMFPLHYGTSKPEMAERYSPEMAEEHSSLPYYSSPANGDSILLGGRRRTDIESLLAMGDYSAALAQIEKDEDRIRMELMQHEHDRSIRGTSQENTGVKLDSLVYNLLQLLYWKANALIGLNRTEEAVMLLEKIRHSESNYKEQADSLYNVLKKRK